MAQECAILRKPRNCQIAAMARAQRKVSPTASDQLESLLGYAWPFAGRPPVHDVSTWAVVDDWPEVVPISIAEIDVFDRWFGDLFDEIADPDP